jgi:hypothetical protein
MVTNETTPALSDPSGGARRWRRPHTSSEVMPRGLYVHKDVLASPTIQNQTNPADLSNLDAATTSGSGVFAVSNPESDDFGAFQKVVVWPRRQRVDQEARGIFLSTSTKIAMGCCDYAVVMVAFYGKTGGWPMNPSQGCVAAGVLIFAAHFAIAQTKPNPGVIVHVPQACPVVPAIDGCTIVKDPRGGPTYDISAATKKPDFKDGHAIEFYGTVDSPQFTPCPTTAIHLRDILWGPSKVMCPHS